MGYEKPISYASLTELARAIKPRVAERAAQTERDGSVSKETIAELKAGGFFRGMQSKRFGGLEVHPADYFGAIIEMASVCPSTGWVMGIVGIHQFELAKFPLALQQEVLGSDPDTLISSSYAVAGTARRVPGGYQLSGEWKSSSGVDHVQWAVLQGNVLPDEEGGELSKRVFYVPISDATILNDWDTTGLNGTGSKSVVVKDAFVPEHRVLSKGGFGGTEGESSPSSDSPLYRIPQLLMFLLPGSAPAIGAAKGAFELFLSVSRLRRQRLDGTSMLEDPMVQRRIGTAKYLIETAELRLMNSINAMVATVEAGEPITPEEYARYFWDFSRAGDDSLTAIRGVFECMGSSAIYSTHPLGRFYRDLIAIRQHGTQNPDRGAVLVGKTALGFV